MELVTIKPKTTPEQVVIAPIGDIQWSGPQGSTAKEALQSHIEWCMEQDAYFLGMGDYIDFASPSNRQQLRAAGIYDTAEEVIEAKARELTQEVFDMFLRPTVGRWLGLLEGHHFFEFAGMTTDMLLAEMLKAPCLGTSAFIRLEFKPPVTLWATHGTGGGLLPSSPLNRLYHVAAGWEGADVYLMGHTTKMPSTRLSRPFPIWGKTPTLQHRDILLVNTGGFSRSSIVGSRRGRIPRGDYAERRMLTPSPLTAPVLIVRPHEEGPRRVRFLG